MSVTIVIERKLTYPVKADYVLGFGISFSTED